MSNQLTLAYTVNVAGTSYGPAKAAAALQEVVLYDNPSNDPTLGQFLGLTVASDTTTQTTTTATRTLVLNMTSAAGNPGVPPTAPPAFPCNPITATPPVLADAQLAYYGEAGLFANGDTVTGTTSGATGVVARAADNGSGAGTLFFSSTTGVFVAGEVLTGAPSGATAKAASLTYTGETGLFAVGATVTGSVSHATGVIAAVDDNGNGGNGSGAGTLFSRPPRVLLFPANCSRA